MNILKKLFFDESGSPALEYALILGLVGVAVFVAMQNLSVGTTGLMETLTTKVTEMNTELAGAGQ